MGFLSWVGHKFLKPFFVESQEEKEKEGQYSWYIDMRRLFTTSSPYMCDHGGGAE